LFEGEVRKLEIHSQRQNIARSLHDGYVQALAGVNLRLGTSRELLARGNVGEASHELEELQRGVAREYDEVRSYLRGLAGIDQSVRRSAPLGGGADPTFQLDAMYTGSAQVGEHLLQIMLEGLRNAQRHAKADNVIVSLIETREMTLLKIDDNGMGFSDADKAPWSIVSRVKELGGSMTLSEVEGSTSLTIELPNT
jgi:signal transduction histidine kinase